ncbi:hypothetical protein AM1_E0016 (plasmid) [Acaryochloris marina MBIC11017]|uniref:Uncharacterized protein n=1 Tax=Acaryochloris marina (strain MBIC 11017) TaxID=329726 RepID=A8ZP50_ACAM1|nr:hypothetical protein AM1_E0016 [Acaryochloris marina MBIC11017]
MDFKVNINRELKCLLDRRYRNLDPLKTPVPLMLIKVSSYLE